MRKNMMRSCCIVMAFLLGGVLYAQDDLNKKLEKDSSRAVTNLAEFGTDYLRNFLENLEGRRLFTSSEEPGVCLLKGTWPYKFPDCAGLIGGTLEDCCSTKTKNNVDRGKLIKGMGQPSWMKENNSFAHANNFFTGPIN